MAYPMTNDVLELRINPRPACGSLVYPAPACLVPRPDFTYRLEYALALLFFDPQKQTCNDDSAANDTNRRRYVIPYWPGHRTHGTVEPCLISIGRTSYTAAGYTNVSWIA